MRETELSVLRPARLRHIQIRHDLQSLHKARVNVQARPLHRLQRAVHAVPQLQFRRVGADVDVARAKVQALRKDLIHRRDDRFLARRAVLAERDKVRACHRSDQRVRTLNQGPQRNRLAQHGIDIDLENAPQLVHRPQVERIGHAHRRDIFAHEQRKRPERLGRFTRQQRRVREPNAVVPEIHKRTFGHLRANQRHRPRLEDAQRRQGFVRRAAALRRIPPSLLSAGRIDQPFFQKRRQNEVIVADHRPTSAVLRRRSFRSDSSTGAASVVFAIETPR